MRTGYISRVRALARRREIHVQGVQQSRENSIAACSSTFSSSDLGTLMVLGGGISQYSHKKKS